MTEELPTTLPILPEFKPVHDGYSDTVRSSFAKQGLMRTLGAELADIRPGFVAIRLPFNPGLTQQHGFFHAGGLASIVDSAGGYAAFSLFGDGDGVLTVEFKLNLMAPADGDYLIARGQVIRPGRTLTVTTGEVIAVKGGQGKPCALMQQTVMRIVGRDGVVG
ncbi:MAG: PaaI family thioesterase [Proteobacteria bacterium]|nr:PaaI family thioesterase [Pseudomonadota bacterium]